jgi:hypothetical protein
MNSIPSFSKGYKATAISAAHCFEHIDNILHPNKPHHATTPREFLPPPSEVDLKQVKAFYINLGQVHICPIEIAIWDSGTDLATLVVLAPNDEPELFRDFVWLDDQIPSIGDQVVMIGFGEMVVTTDAETHKREQCNDGLLSESDVWGKYSRRLPTSLNLQVSRLASLSIAA